MRSVLFIPLALLAVFTLGIPSVPTSMVDGKEKAFTTRVDEFWGWFKDNEERIHSEMFSEAGRANNDAIDKQLSKVFGSIGWVFGPGESEGDHSLTVSAEGDPHQRLLAHIWKERGPEFDGWDFYASRQPGLSLGSQIDIDGLVFGFNETMVDVKWNEEWELADVVIHHPSMLKADESVATQVAFILIDEAIGENRTELWVGKVEQSGKPAPKTAVTLFELEGHLLALAKKHDLPLDWSFEQFDNYQITPENLSEDCPRRDVMAGSTCHFPIVADFYDHSGKLPNPIANTGAYFAYIEIPGAGLGEDFRRYELEDLIVGSSDELRVLGGATGTETHYIDILILNRQAAEMAIQKAFAKQDTIQTARLLPFALKGPAPLTLSIAPKDTSGEK